MRTTMEIPGQMDGGSDTVATNGLNSATLVIAHALGRVPDVVLATPRNSVNAICQCTARSSSDITIQVAHRDVGTNLGADTVVDWLAR